MLHPSKYSFFSPGTRRRLRQRALVLLLASGLFSLGAHAMSLTIVDPNRAVVAGSNTLFSGTIMNDTGVSLSTSDLFLNFSGFDPVAVTITPLLGDVDFPIPDGMTTPVTDLFRASLGSNATPATTYFIDVVLQDGNGNFASVETVSLTQVPEPASILLVLAGIAIIGGASRIPRVHRVSRV